MNVLTFNTGAECIENAKNVRNRLMYPDAAFKVENRSLKADINRLKAQLQNAYKTLESREDTISELKAEMLSQAVKISQLKEVTDTDGLRPVKLIILDVLYSYPGITYEDVLSKSVRRDIVAARHECMKTVYAIRTDLSSTQIAKQFQKDHTSFLSACGRLEKKPATWK